MNYTPSPPQAYLDVLALRSDTWFGDLLRNIHHWSANLLVLVAVLHLLRVFFTGGHRPPRENNWIFGLVMLLLALVMLMSMHFWRVRKDGGLTMPRKIDENEDPKPERVTTIPHLVRREMVWAVAWIAILLLFSMFVPAPLEEIADPMHSPNPAKAPWYFLGLQELLLHFHPVIAGVVIPILALGALFLLPFFDISAASVGVYFRSRRGRVLSLLAGGLSLLLTPAWIVADEFLIDWAGWLPTWPTLLSNGVIPLALVLLGLIAPEQVVYA